MSKKNIDDDDWNAWVADVRTFVSQDIEVVLSATQRMTESKGEEFDADFFKEDWNDIINTNLTSVYKMSKAVLRGMIKKRAGRIISITSVVGAMGNAGQSNYAAAKAGIMGFTKSLAREVGVRGITVNAIAPGFIETDMTDSLPENQKELLASQIPMGRLGTVNEVAQAVLFLAGDSGSYITAQTLHINGGMYTL